MEQWPNFFILGAPKHEYLKGIPGIYMSPVKEPRFFNRINLPDNHPKTKIRDKLKYLELFAGVRDEKIVGEASPGYLADPGAVKLIHDVSPNAKALISLRDPVERAFSLLLMRVRDGKLEESDLTRELEYAVETRNERLRANSWLRNGKYSEGVRRSIEVLGNQNVKVVIFEEWIGNPKETIQEILRFLDIDHEMTTFDAKPLNPYGVSRGPVARYFLKNGKVLSLARSVLSPSARRNLKEQFLLKKQPKPELQEDHRRFLVDFYRKDVNELETLLGRKLPWKNFHDARTGR
jgi:hypothetical protein